MRLPVPMLIGALIVPTPLFAQPPAGHGGPLAADSDGDGQISRAEMTTWIDGQFVGMDSDGDGRVPVQAMRQILGHERQPRDASAATGEGRQSRGPGGAPGGMGRGGGMGDSGGMSQGGGGMGGPGGAGGPPPGGRPPADAQARHAEGPPPGPPGSALPWPEDGNDDGMIDHDEFAAPALAMFADMDRNGDGVLTGDELPPPPPGQPPAPE